MARPASAQPTDGELEILKVLWEHGPSGLKQVCDGLRRARPVATTTVATMLKLMQEKGLVARGAGEDARGSVYSARISREAASTGLIRRLVDVIFDGSARRLMAHMLENENLSERDHAEIRRLLDEDDAEGQGTTPTEERGPFMSWNTETVWLAVGWTMLHFFWVGGLIGSVTAIVLWVLRRASAGGTIRRGAGKPGAIGRGARGDLFGERDSLAGASWLMRQPVDQNVPAIAPRFVRRVEEASAARGGMETVRPSGGGRDQSPDRRGMRQRRTWRAYRQTLERLAARLPWLWLVGSPITFVWLALGLAGAERLRRHGAVVSDGELPRLCRKLAAELGIARDVAVAVCDRLAAPVLVGVVRPMILLPAAALGGWGPDQLEMVLLHELAHVRRWDNLVNLLQRLVESALFFHPAVWIVSGWVRREREHCCDGVVVARTGRARAYAETLLALAGPGTDRMPRAAVAMAQHDLVGRVRRILNPHPEGHAMKLHRGLLAPDRRAA